MPQLADIFPGTAYSKGDSSVHHRTFVYLLRMAQSCAPFSRLIKQPTPSRYLISSYQSSYARDKSFLYT